MDEPINDESINLYHRVERILRSRRICRPFQRAPLSNIQRNLLEQARQYLLDDLVQKSHSVTSEPSQDDAWAAELWQLAFREVLDDANLTELAISAQNCPVGSALRRHIAVIRLLRCSSSNE